MKIEFREAVCCISCKAVDNGVYEIGCLCVRPEFQGKGIGTAAVAFAKSHYVDWKKITLITPVDKKENVRFYTERKNAALRLRQLRWMEA